ncbi:MAG: hypothetical protein QM811_17920 [Pirellulales bacterium]
MGLWCLLQAANSAIRFCDLRIQANPEYFAADLNPVSGLLVNACGYAALAATMLLCADAMVAVTYGPLVAHAATEESGDSPPAT